MLGKLMKHELKACSRLLLPLYILLAVLSIVERIMIALDDKNIFNGIMEIIPATITFAFGLSLFSIAVVSIVLIIYRFYKNLVTEEGYLMFTLPVKTHQLVNSKLIIAVLWLIASVLAIIASLLIVFGNLSEWNTMLREIKHGLSEFHTLIGNQYIPFVIQGILFAITGLVCFLLHIYASIAVGQLLSKHKILGCVIAFVVFNFIQQIATTLLLVFFVELSHKSYEDIRLLTQVITPIALVINIVFVVAFYFTTIFIFQKKLNLE